jgi:hypothetical protein
MPMAVARATVLLHFQLRRKQVKRYGICSFVRKALLNEIYFLFSQMLELIMFFQMNEMKGKIIEKKPLYVSVAERKEERKARLQVMLVFYFVNIFI